MEINAKYIFDHERSSCLSNVPGEQKWGSPSMWQFIDFRLLAEKMWKIHWKQFVTLLIEQIQSKHNKNMITACHNNDIIFFLLSRDIRFFKKGHQKRPMGQTRWPSIFSSLGVIWSHKKQTKLEYFVILRILIFQCPGTTHITNFTRMPLKTSPYHVLCATSRQSIHITLDDTLFMLTQDPSSTTLLVQLHHIPLLFVNNPFT